MDHIAVVADGFRDGDLNGKLQAPEAHWGGCGMNLAYGLARMNAAALPWVFYGDDCPSGYLNHIRDQRFDETMLFQQSDAACAAAYIFTRHDGSQLTGFYPGSTSFSDPNVDQTNQLHACQTWIAGPEDDTTLLRRLPHISQATSLYWMPGQYAELTGNNVLEPMLRRRPNLVVNSKEWAALIQIVGEQQLLATVAAVFITRGKDGVRYRAAASEPFYERPTDAVEALDPTGCGDAFCAALVAGLTQGLDIAQTIDHAQLQAALCLVQTGAQRY